MTIKTKIENLDYYGRGISHLDKEVVFIENALPEEVVEIEIINKSKNFSEGKVTKYIINSKDRVTPECPYYDICGGCNLSHLNEINQLKFKKDQLINIIKKYSDLNIEPTIIESSKTKNYRNKVSLKIKNSKWGYYESKTHNFTAIENCLLAKESINKIINEQNLFKISEGEIMIRSNYIDEILISISSNFKVDFNLDKLKENNKILGIILNDKIIYGEDSFIEKIDKYLFKVSINSFFQINLNILSEVFYIISRKNYNNIIDLYCGVGTLGIPIKKNNLYGIETSVSSVKDALINAKMNKQLNNFYILGDSSKINEIKEEIDMLLIDPPRNGINKNTMRHIMQSNIKEIIYMSCNPQTLAKDLNILNEKYNVKETYLLNMFPQTYHIETIILLHCD